MKKNVAQEKMDEIVSKLIKSIENNETGLWCKSWIGNGLPSNYASKTTYSGFNVLSLLFMQEEMGWSSNQFLTFNQIRKIKGAHLKKGSESTPVFFFKIIEKENKEDKKKIDKIPLLKFFYVYNLDQVEGIEIGTEKPHNSDLDEFVSNCNVEIKTRSEAYYSPSKDYIGIPDLKMFNSVESYASTILHEISHSTAHKTRLNRDLSGRFSSPAYAREEVVVELSSIFLCQHLGIKNENEHKQSEAYIKNWLIDSLKAEPKLLWKISSEAQKIFNYLLELQTEQQEAA